MKSYFVTEHAVERYVSRVKPALPLLKAKLEIEGLIERLAPELQSERPFWLGADRYPNSQYLLLTDTIAFAVEEGRIVTCLVDGEVSDLTRARRKAAKRQRAEERRADQPIRLDGRKGRREMRSKSRSRIESEAWPT